jgi:hypothetical protein
MTNYRPISLLTVFSKLLERVICSGLSHHIYFNNMLVSEQFGLRQGTSTKNAAFKLTDSVLDTFNKKVHVGGIFCDLADT